MISVLATLAFFAPAAAIITIPLICAGAIIYIGCSVPDSVDPTLIYSLHANLPTPPPDGWEEALKVYGPLMKRYHLTESRLAASDLHNFATLNHHYPVIPLNKLLTNSSGEYILPYSYFGRKFGEVDLGNVVRYFEVSPADSEEIDLIEGTQSYHEDVVDWWINKCDQEDSGQITLSTLRWVKSEANFLGRQLYMHPNDWIYEKSVNDIIKLVDLNVHYYENYELSGTSTWGLSSPIFTKDYNFTTADAFCPKLAPAHLEHDILGLRSIGLTPVHIDDEEIQRMPVITYWRPGIPDNNYFRAFVIPDQFNWWGLEHRNIRSSAIIAMCEYLATRAPHDLYCDSTENILKQTMNILEVLSRTVVHNNETFVYYEVANSPLDTVQNPLMGDFVYENTEKYDVAMIC